VGSAPPGIIGRAFAARHPGDVAALMLVDAWHERLADELLRFYEQLAAMYYDADQAIRVDNIVAALPGLGYLPLTMITSWPG
jgi:pimeloyl-ACP methyl ester carboxylesterase